MRHAHSCNTDTTHRYIAYAGLYLHTLTRGSLHSCALHALSRATPALFRLMFDLHLWPSFFYIRLVSTVRSLAPRVITLARLLISLLVSFPAVV